MYVLCKIMCMRVFPWTHSSHTEQKPSNTRQHLGFVFNVYVNNQLIFPTSIESAVVTGVLLQL